MSLLPQDASFEELVQDCFLAFRGSGLMLSPLDLQLVTEWREAGVPFEVVARGIRKAAEKAVWDARPGEPALRSLRACRRQVEAEIEKHKARAVGGRDGDEEGGGAPEGSEQPHPPHRRSLVEERHARLKSAVKKMAKEHGVFAATVERLLGGLLAEPPVDLSAAGAVEERVMAALLRGLPYESRLQVLRDAKAQVGDASPLSGRARKLSRRFHNSAALRKAFSLPSFW
jgi:hypothetical protein